MTELHFYENRPIKMTLNVDSALGETRLATRDDLLKLGYVHGDAIKDHISQVLLAAGLDPSDDDAFVRHVFEVVCGLEAAFTDKERDRVFMLCTKLATAVRGMETTQSE